MKVILLPFGSYLVKGESRDQDFVAFPFDQTLAGLLDPTKYIYVEADWNTEGVSMGAQKVGFPDPDIWMSDQVGDMKPIIVANLVKDYPEAAGYIQKAMGGHVNIQGGDVALKEALDANVRRWKEGVPHTPNIRKRVFSRIQRDAYAQGLGFFNTKSEIAQAAVALQFVGDSTGLCDFLTGKNVEPWYDRPSDPKSLSKVISSLVSGQENVHSYQSEHGRISDLPCLEGRIPWRAYLTPIETRGKKVCVFWEEIYTYQSFSGMVEIEEEIWSMLLNIDLKEVK